MEQDKKQIVEDFIQNFYKPRLVEGLNGITECKICNFRDGICDILDGELKLLAFGNGGSEAIAKQFVYSVNRVGNAKARMGIKINEIDYDDLVLLVSASGNSDNINSIALNRQELGGEVASISGKGKVIDKSDTALVIPESDQQIKEDIMQVAVHILVRLLGGFRDCDRFPCSASEVQTNYINKVESIFNRIVNSKRLVEITEDIIKAFRERKTVRIDSPGNDKGAISAEHIAHNLKWDALSNLETPVSNRVYSGLSSCHFSGVSNDGGEEYNYAIEIESTMWEGDVLILFGDVDDKAIQNTIKAANRNNVTTHTIDLAGVDDDISADVIQITGHIIGRILNTFLLLNENSITIEDLGKQLELDLARLRTREKTRILLEQQFA